jgi:hypothetical protein
MYYSPQSQLPIKQLPVNQSMMTCLSSTGRCAGTSTCHASSDTSSRTAAPTCHPNSTHFVSKLAASQHTPAFLMGAVWDRHSCYLRPPDPPGSAIGAQYGLNALRTCRSPKRPVSRISARRPSAGSPPPHVRTPGPGRTRTRSAVWSVNSGTASAIRSCCTGRFAKPLSPSSHRTAPQALRTCQTGRKPADHAGTALSQHASLMPDWHPSRFRS